MKKCCENCRHNGEYDLEYAKHLRDTEGTQFYTFSRIGSDNIRSACKLGWYKDYSEHFEDSGCIHSRYQHWEKKEVIITPLEDELFEI